MIILAALLAASIDLIELHSPDGSALLLNPHEITSMRAPVGPTPPGTRCAIYMANSNAIGVREDCQTVRNKITLEGR